MNIVARAGLGALLLSSSTLCYAQSTGTIAAEESAGEDVVVTGEKVKDAIGIGNPDSPKARAVVTRDFIEHTVPGQSIFNAINLIPGVNFISGDPYGGSGGGIRIRGFDGSRISFTFDGLPLNDAGNYAIYANQQIDPELVESVNVNFGATDVDSPTASAAGGTVNYRTTLRSRDRRSGSDTRDARRPFLLVFGRRVERRSRRACSAGDLRGGCEGAHPSPLRAAAQPSL